MSALIRMIAGRVTGIYIHIYYVMSFDIKYLLEKTPVTSNSQVIL